MGKACWDSEIQDFEHELTCHRRRIETFTRSPGFADKFDKVTLNERIKKANVKPIGSLLLVALLAIVSISAAGIFSQATQSQTYFLSTGSGVPEPGCPPQEYGMSFASNPTANSININGQQTWEFCGNAEAPILTNDATFVLWFYVTGDTSATINATLQDLTQGGIVIGNATETLTSSATSCSSPALATIELDRSPVSVASGDALNIIFTNNEYSGVTVYVCTGGSYPSTLTVSPFLVSTTTSLSSTTSTSLSTTTSTTTSTATSTTTVFVYPTTTQITCSPNKVQHGKSSTCTTIVQSTTTPSGTITIGITDGKSHVTDTIPCTAISSTECSAKQSFNFPISGSAIVAATYNGDVTHQSSNGATIVHVTR